MARTKNPNRGKGKEPASSSHPPSPFLPQIRLFANDDQQERYFNYFESRDVLEGRYLDLEFLESTNFLYVATFKEFGWWDFLSIHRSIYKDTVRAFYSNASITFGREKSTERFKINIWFYLYRG